MKRKAISFFLILSVFVYWSSPVYAAWGGEENFNSYSEGVGLDGDNAGSGWSCAWGSCGIKGNAGDYTTTAASAYEGARGVDLNSAHADSYIERPLTSTVSAGDMYVAFRANQTNKVANYWTCVSTTCAVIGGVRFNSSGNIDYVDSSGFHTLLTGYSSGQYYVFHFYWDQAGHANQYGVAVGITSFTNDSGYVTTNGSVSATVGAVQLEGTANSATAHFYYDDITATNPIPVVVNRKSNPTWFLQIL